MANLTINGKTFDIDVEPDTPLLWAIRENIGLTGTKYGCGIAQCGAGSVHVNGEVRRSCSIAVGSLAGFGWSGPIWLQWLLFSAISLLSLLCFRPHLVRATRSKERPDPIDTLEGETALLVDDLQPDAVGRAELRGTTWTVRNGDQRLLVRGQRCRVSRVDGLTLWIHGE